MMWFRRKFIGFLLMSVPLKLFFKRFITRYIKVLLRWMMRLLNRVCRISRYIGIPDIILGLFWGFCSCYVRIIIGSFRIIWGIRRMQGRAIILFMILRCCCLLLWGGLGISRFMWLVSALIRLRSMCRGLVLRIRTWLLRVSLCRLLCSCWD